MRQLLVATTNPGKLREIRELMADVPVSLVCLADLPPVAEPEETGATFEENARLKARYYAAHSGLLTVAEDSGLEIDALGREPGVRSARFLGPDASYPERFAEIFRRLDAYPDAGPDARPDSSSDSSSEASSGASSHASPDASQDTPAGASPSASPSASPGASPDANPDAAPDAARNAAPDRGRSARFVAALACVDGDRVIFETTGVVEGEIAREPRGTGGFGYDPIFYYPHYGRTLAEVTQTEKSLVAHRGVAFRAFADWLKGTKGLGD